MIRWFALICFALCLGCPSFPPRPDWVKSPHSYARGKGSLLLVSSTLGKKEEEALKQKVKRDGREKMSRFLREKLRDLLSNYALQMGDLPDSQAWIALLKKQKFQETLVKALRDLISDKEIYYDREKKKMFCLIGIKKDAFLFKLRNQMVEKLENTGILSPQSKEKAKERLNGLLKREAKYLSQKFENWRNKIVSVQ